jgi:hypothetical protein
MAQAPNKTTTARVEMKARVTRWSNQLNKLSDEIADWSLTSRNPTVALQTGGHSGSYGDGPLVDSDRKY